MKLTTFLCLTIAVLSGCSRSADSPVASASSVPTSQDAKQAELRMRLKAITLGGISKSEAELIAQCYFQQNVGCGAFTGIRDGDDLWIVEGAFGYAGRPIQGFHIDKTTGKITSPIGPSYATPAEIFP